MRMRFHSIIRVVCALTCLGMALACDSGRKRMAAPPSEPPEALLAPEPLPEGARDAQPVVVSSEPAAPVTVVQTEAPPQEITIAGTTEIVAEKKPPLEIPRKREPAFFHLCGANDSLATIAREYNVDARQLAQINGMTENAALAAKQVLALPRDLDKITLAPDVTTYTVAGGDTYSRIARKYRIAPQTLMYLNKAKSTALQVGDVVYVPNLGR